MTSARSLVWLVPLSCSYAFLVLAAVAVAVAVAVAAADGRVADSAFAAVVADSAFAVVVADSAFAAVVAGSASVAVVASGSGIVLAERPVHLVTAPAAVPCCVRQVRCTRTTYPPYVARSLVRLIYCNSVLPHLSVPHCSH